MFRAFDPDRDRLVVVKLFTFDLAPERVHQVAAGLERLIACALVHPGIVAPLATGIQDNRPYLAQEYVSAESFDVSVREQGAASPSEALRVAAQLASALDFAAVDGIVHGALHPRDVLLTPDETRLTGLGIARAFESAGVPAPVRRPYSPPECIAGRPWDRRADVFSLAALIHELLWGRRLTSTGAQAGDALTDLPGGHMDALRLLFGRALAEDPSERFETALEFAEGLKQALPKAVLSARSRRSTPRAGLIEPRLPLDEPEPAEPPALESVTPEAIVMPAVERDLNDLSVLDELPIRAAERPRFEDVEPPPTEVGAIAEPDVEPDISRVASAPADVPAGLLNLQPEMDFGTSATRSAIWPLGLALVVGAALGFGGGYFFANFERAVTPDAVTRDTVATSAATAPAPSAREYTENTVAVAPKAAAAPVGTTTAGAGNVSTPAVSPASSPASATPAPRAQRPAPSAPASAPAASAGRLNVRSTPSGARVFVDGREQGKTPLAIDDLARGVHRVRVVREGYATEERRITITAARPAQSMTVPLARAKQAEASARPPAPAPPAATGPGQLMVISRPAGAQVFVDDTLIGVTPLQMPEVAPGTHAIHLDLDGYRRWSSSIRVSPAELARVTASLER